ncbi:type I restriction endonuclease subunit R [Mycoplasmopsis agassizii]|uniref:Type I restriction endonuclease subunit R n=1 Tax=Mycoplasmopsis agassizii TaxID=33922 RepID=A0ABX4H431_9BACT|nr:type I restriction endonuclease [Mycoplasmopsis agassizii]PAF54649.1 type I restriction endonuclease subunit R [Mycoplasmopsis agassizii]SMC16179.1 type I restriction enzyme, R subunit [Mycoplasmopsis agassizii]
MEDNEKRFEQDIETHLLDKGYIKLSSYEYDIDKGLYLNTLISFIKSTQERSWRKHEKYYGERAIEAFYQRLQKSIDERGLLDVIRKGFEDMGTKFFLCFFKPETKLNEETVDKYNKNILSVSRQFKYSNRNNNTIDMVISINGIPLVALELKNQLKGQDYKNAIKQFKENRDPREFVFKLNNRILIYFALDLYEVWVSTKLDGYKTDFLPFNQGRNGSGKSGASGNPENKEGYATSYLWENILDKDNFLDIINKFISKPKDQQKIIFPRFHQYDVVKKVLTDVKENGVGKNYLIEHSAGSGKSNSISWLAYRLASIHDKNDLIIFDTVIIVTNRIVLDSQLQETIKTFEHTRGLIETIDQRKGSKGLVEAINDKKRIIICTIQKFLHAYKDFKNMSGRNFAIIVDEAHLGQTGEAARKLRKGLIDKKEAVNNLREEHEIDELDEGGELIYEIISQGKHKNQSFFAFTATPKNKTIELFGRHNPESKKTEPFHVYSMRQAIEEGFILDVLKYYSTFEEQARIIKTTEDNPEVYKDDAKKQIYRLIKNDKNLIRSKVELIMNNFLSHGIHEIDKKAKAMVVTSSRSSAVKYFFEIKNYLQRKYGDASQIGVLVAFSGEVNLHGKTYREADLNKDNNGDLINTDKKFRKMFHSDQYKILVVANKYQTGFDEPLLHSMYIDKKLIGVSAVQTLSRLNRKYPKKTSTFVMDFVNKSEVIKSAFQPFYEATYLEGITDPNIVYDLKNKIYEFNLYDIETVNKFYEIVKVSLEEQNKDDLGKASSLFIPIEEKYKSLTTAEQNKYRDLLNKFNRLYLYITQMIRIHDTQLLKDYSFTSYLVRLLPKTDYEKISISDKVQIDFIDIHETFKGSIDLEKTSADLSVDKIKKDLKTERPKSTLEKIIEEVNDFYGDIVDPDKKAIEFIYNEILNDSDLMKKIHSYIKNNDRNTFVETWFPTLFWNIIINSLQKHGDNFPEKLRKDDGFTKFVMQLIAKKIWDEFTKQTDT